MACDYPFGHDGPGGSQTRSVLQNIRSGTFRFPAARTISGNLQDLIRGMLTVDRASRLTIGQIKEHPWVREGWDGEEDVPMDSPAEIDWSAVEVAPPSISAMLSAESVSVVCTVLIFQSSYTDTQLGDRTCLMTTIISMTKTRVWGFRMGENLHLH